MKKLISVLSLFLLFVGCYIEHDTSDALPLGTHKVSVRPRCISKEINNRFPAGEAIYNLTCVDNKVTIKNEELIVNGKSYGGLNKGDAVHVDNGSVFVNGKQRQEQTKP